MFRLKNKSNFLLVFFLIASPVEFLKAEGESLSWLEQQKKKLPSWKTVKRQAIPTMLVGLWLGMQVKGALDMLGRLDDSKDYFHHLDVYMKKKKSQGFNFRSLPYEELVAEFGTGEGKAVKDRMDLAKKRFEAGFNYWLGSYIPLLASMGYKLALDYWDKYQQEKKNIKEEAEKEKRLEVE